VIEALGVVLLERVDRAVDVRRDDPTEAHLERRVELR
jgi:hypothetical protein